MNRAHKSLVALLLVSVWACESEDISSGGSSTSPPPAQPASSGNACEGWAVIFDPFGCIAWYWDFGDWTSDTEVTVTGDELLLSGRAFVSPEDSNCCPPEPGVTVMWSNDTTGEFGTAASSILAIGSGSPADWKHEWQARIPLGPGANEISIVAADRSGNWGRRSLKAKRRS